MVLDRKLWRLQHTSNHSFKSKFKAVTHPFPVSLGIPINLLPFSLADAKETSMEAAVEAVLQN